MAQPESSPFDSSAIDPETYFQRALMGMSMIEEECPSLCKCAFCCSMNKSSCSVASSSTFTADCSTISDDEEARSSTSSDVDELFVRKVGYEEGEPACIVLPMSDDYSSSRFSTAFSKKDTKSIAHVDERQIKDLERRLKNAQFRDNDLHRRKLQLEMERDSLRSLLEEVETKDVLRKLTQSAKLERIYEHDEE